MKRVSFQLFLAMIEFGLSQRLKEIVTVTDLRVERILRQGGWYTRRLGNPKQVGVTRAVAVAGEVSLETWNSVRNKINIFNPVLFQSVI